MFVGLTAAARQERTNKSLAALLLTLLAAGLTSVLILYWGQGNEDIVITLNEFLPEIDKGALVICSKINTLIFGCRLLYTG